MTARSRASHPGTPARFTPRDVTIALRIVDKLESSLVITGGELAHLRKILTDLADRTVELLSRRRDPSRRNRAR